MPSHSALTDKNPQNTPGNSNHNLMVQIAQTQANISRLDYVNTSLSASYYCKEPKEQVKLCCKVLVFDFNFGIFKGSYVLFYKTNELANQKHIRSEFGIYHTKKF